MSAPAWLTTLPDDHLADGDLVVRAWRPGDAPWLLTAVLESIEELRPWLPWAHRGYGPEEAAEFIDHAVGARGRGGDLLYAVLEGDELVGAVGLHAGHEPARLEIGYWLHSARTGRGLATRSVRLLAAAALRLPEVTCLEIRHDRANVPSGRIPQRLGFERVAVRSRPPRAPGETELEHVWHLTDPARLVERHPGPPPA